MSADHLPPTREEARDQLAMTRARSLRSPRDRRVHAAGTALLGAAIGIGMAPRNLVTGTLDVVLTVVFLAAWIGGIAWMERGTRTVPRGARRWSRGGVAASFVVGLGAVLPWLNLRAQTEPNTWPMVLVGAAAIAAPSLLAAAVIAGGRK